MRIFKSVLFSSGLFHPNVVARAVLKDGFISISNLHLTTAHSLRALSSPKVQQADLWILYFHKRNLSSSQLMLMQTYISGGGNILAIHSAAASFKQTQAYEKILGGKFVYHGDITPYTIMPTPSKDPIFSITTPFEIKDELYFHKYDLDCQVHYHTLQNGETEPVLWTREHNPGRIVYFAPGHCTATFRNTQVKTILSDSVRWLLENKKE